MRRAGWKRHKLEGENPEAQAPAAASPAGLAPRTSRASRARPVPVARRRRAKPCHGPRAGRRPASAGRKFSSRRRGTSAGGAALSPGGGDGAARGSLRLQGPQAEEAAGALAVDHPHQRRLPSARAVLLGLHVRARARRGCARPEDPRRARGQRSRAPSPRSRRRRERQAAPSVARTPGSSRSTTGPWRRLPGPGPRPSWSRSGVRVLGRSGALTALLRSLGALPAVERPRSASRRTG